MLSAWALSVVVSTTSVTQDSPMVEEGPYSSEPETVSPVIRRFDRYSVDQARKQAWLSYCRELDKAWAEYRAAGSTAEAIAKYKTIVSQAKTRYVYQDPYYAPILP